MKIWEYFNTRYSHYGVYGPEEHKRIAGTGNQVNPHDPDQEKQTADIARDKILSHYPQVKP